MNLDRSNNNNANGAADRGQGQARLLWAAGLVALVVFGRLMPHAANFAPAVAAGLLAGFVFRSRFGGVAVVLVAMLLSDLVIGYDSLAMRVVVYASLTLPVVLGVWLRGHERRASHANSRLAFAGSLGAASLGSSLVFFLTTNLAVWLQSGMYAISWTGLLACYVNAIPFFRTAIAGDLVYAAILFGSYGLVRAASDRRLAVAVA